MSGSVKGSRICRLCRFLWMLALSFLLLIGFSLVAEGFDRHIPKGYIYFAMGFSVIVEMINLRIRSAVPVRLQRTYPD